MRGSGWRPCHHSLERILKCPNTLSCTVRTFKSPSAHPYKSAVRPRSKDTTTQARDVAPDISVKARALSSPLPTASTSNPNQVLNPPSTTRPPALTRPTRTDADPAFKYYYNLGKAYITLYKIGLKGIYSNYKVAASLPNRSFHPLFASRHTLYAAALSRRLSRAELQLLVRLRADTKVLPLFALVLLCCGEFTPLLVPWLTAIVPPTVHIPTQTNSLRKNVENIRQQARLEGPVEWRSIRNIWDIKQAPLDDKYRDNMRRRLATELGVYPRWSKILPSMLSSPLVKRRLMRRLQELQYDDITIMRDGGVEGMISEEVIIACDKRGFAVEDKEDKELRKMLHEWLTDRNSNRAQEFVEWVRGRSWEDWRGNVTSEQANKAKR